MKNIKKLNFFKTKKNYYLSLHLIFPISLPEPKLTNMTEDLSLGTGIGQLNFSILKVEL